MTTSATPVPTRRWRRRLLPVALLVVLALIVSACSSADSAGDDAADGAAAPAEAAAVEMAQEEPASAEDESFGLAPGDDGEARGDADLAEPIATSPDTAVTGERIIKEGTVTLIVEPGEFDAAFGQVIARVQALGGHVAGSSSATDDAGLVSGQVTLRVPVRAFEDLLTAIGESGTIVDRAITSQDVTAEFTDLEARRRHLQAQERFYLGLLEDAASITDAIAVQQQLEGIQAQIERITGQLNLLGDRSSFSTLTVRIREQGAEEAEGLADDGPNLASYWEDAQDLFIRTVGALLVALVFATPFLLLLLIGYGVYRLSRGRRAATRPVAAPGSGPAAPSEGVQSTMAAAPAPSPTGEQARRGDAGPAAAPTLGATSTAVGLADRPDEDPDGT